MKRDMELIRKILLEIEENPKANVPPHEVYKSIYPDSIEGHIEDDTFYEHIYLLNEANFIKTEFSENMRFLFSDIRITFEGHEYISSIRNDTVWHKVKSKFGSESINVPYEIVKQLGISLLKESLGLS